MKNHYNQDSIRALDAAITSAIAAIICGIIANLTLFIYGVVAAICGILWICMAIKFFRLHRAIRQRRIQEESRQDWIARQDRKQAKNILI